MHHTSFQILVSPSGIFQFSTSSRLHRSRDLHDKGVSTWFSFCDSICTKCINVKAGDPSVTVMLQSFLCENFRISWSNTISSFSKLNTYVSFKSKFAWKGILIQF